VVTDKLTKPLDSAGWIDWVLEKADGCDTRSARSDAGFCVVQRDAADGDDGNGHRTTRSRKARQALWHSKSQFRWCGEYGTEEDVIGAIALGGFRGFEGMARNAD
jgi:hypothetical protein